MKIQKCQESGQQTLVTSKSHLKSPCLHSPRESCPLASGRGRREGRIPPTRAHPSFQKNIDFPNPMGLGGLPQDNKDSKGFRACALRSDYPGWILDSVTYNCVTLASLFSINLSFPIYKMGTRFIPTLRYFREVKTG